MRAPDWHDLFDAAALLLLLFYVLYETGAWHERT